MLASPARRRMMRVISTARTNNSSLAERLRVRSAIRTRAIFRAAHPLIWQSLNILIIRDAPSLAIRATTRMWARFTLHTLDCMPRPYALARNVASRYRSAPGRSGRGAFQGWGPIGSFGTHGQNHFYRQNRQVTHNRSGARIDRHGNGDQAWRVGHRS